ncbi:MAG TPA: hypothetical protein VEJ20_04630 [Candidatus Eremiobacteraceae bacterium]|nr:hypothetical protein [Candidatus Eremiobacteraceae bacterium]
MKLVDLARAAAGSALIASAVLSVGAAQGGASTTVTIPMKSLNGSGQDGTATLTQVGDKVSVSVTLTNEPSGASEPAHVHLGHCPRINAVPAYNVGPVVGGKATSVVDLTWAEITSGKYVLMTHESTAMLGMYMSCGDIP